MRFVYALFIIGLIIGIQEGMDYSEEEIIQLAEDSIKDVGDSTNPDWVNFLMQGSYRASWAFVMLAIDIGSGLYWLTPITPVIAFFLVLTVIPKGTHFFWVFCKWYYKKLRGMKKEGGKNGKVSEAI
jgi:hypothetical protein